MSVKTKAYITGISTRKFLQEYWQKKPLFIPKALPQFRGLLNPQELQTLACQDEVSSRLIQQNRGRWTLHTGPFRSKDFSKLNNLWTLLVQDVNHHLPAAHELLMQFNFIPYARLDDLMVSFAPHGGGVGPHVDAYDVFLLQGCGQRLWQISSQQDHALVPDAPLRILQRFKTEEEYLLESGDMLYLPPNYAHNGIAMGDCMTYSIGFRAPSYKDLVQEFLGYLQDNCHIQGRYQDPQLRVSADPARINSAMLAQVTKVLQGIRYTKKDIQAFLGNYLSEPKSHSFFEPPLKPLSKAKFLLKSQQCGLELDPKTRMLFTPKQLFINGMEYSFLAGIPLPLKQLANEGYVQLERNLPQAIEDDLYQWYLDGYLSIAA